MMSELYLCEIGSLNMALFIIKLNKGKSLLFMNCCKNMNSLNIGDKPRGLDYLMRGTSNNSLLLYRAR